MATEDEGGWRTGDRARAARDRRPELRVATRWLPRFLAALDAAKVPSAALLAPFELPPRSGQQPELEAPLEALRTLPEEVATLLNRPFVGLELAASVPPLALGLVELGVRCSPTLREGLELNHRVPGTRRALGRQANEVQLAWWVRVIRECLPTPWSPDEVCFAHAAPADTKPLVRFFSARSLQFAMGFNALRFPASALDTPLTSFDPVVLQLFEERAERLVGRGNPEELLTRLRDLIREELRDGRPTLQSVAARLGASPRTLQRRLDGHNTSFNDLLEEVRLTLAKEYLANPRFSAKEIAYLLGYSDPTTFIRAFKRATSMTPLEFRNQK
jgi:AraC-like DNA-binding protein